MAGVKGRSGKGSGKTVAEHKRDGTFRNDRHGHLIVPEDKVTRIQPQEHITNKYVRVNREEVFDYFADYLAKEGMSVEIDSVIISQLVELYALYNEALANIKVDPEAQFGRKMASTVMMETGREIRQIMAEFKLTPNTRDLSNSDTESSADPIADFIDMKVVGE